MLGIQIVYLIQKLAVDTKGPMIFLFSFVSHSPHAPVSKEGDVVIVSFGGSLGHLCSSLICLCIQTDRVQAGYNLH